MTAQEFAPFLEMVITAIKDASRNVRKGDKVRINKTIRIPGYKTHLILSFGNDRNASFEYTAGFEIMSIMPSDEYDDKDSIPDDKDKNYIDMEDGGTPEEIIEAIKNWIDRDDRFDRFLKEDECYDYYQGKWVKTMDVTPTWRQVVDMYIGKVFNSETFEECQGAIDQLRKMAEIADKYNDLAENGKL